MSHWRDMRNRQLGNKTDYRYISLTFMDGAPGILDMPGVALATWAKCKFLRPFALCGPAMAPGNLSALKDKSVFRLPSFCLWNNVISVPEAKCQPTEAPEFGNLNSCCTPVYEANTHTGISCGPSLYPPSSCLPHYSLTFKGQEKSRKMGLCEKELTG